MKTKWGRAKGGYVDSKCGRYNISPNYCGTTRPQDYKVWERIERKYIANMEATITDAKDAVERYKERIKAR